MNPVSIVISYYNNIHDIPIWYKSFFLLNVASSYCNPWFCLSCRCLKLSPLSSAIWKTPDVAKSLRPAYSTQRHDPGAWGAEWAAAIPNGQNSSHQKIIKGFNYSLIEKIKTYTKTCIKHILKHLPLTWTLNEPWEWVVRIQKNAKLADRVAPSMPEEWDWSIGWWG